MNAVVSAIKDTKMSMTAIIVNIVYTTSLIFAVGVTILSFLLKYVKNNRMARDKISIT